jgi:hypothetical protein
VFSGSLILIAAARLVMIPNSRGHEKHLPGFLYIEKLIPAEYVSPEYPLHYQSFV